MNDKVDLEVIKNLILKNGKNPKDKIGELGEQFTEAVFKEAPIKRVSRKGVDSPFPDYNIFLNEKSFLLETTVLRKIYIEYKEILEDICIEKKNKKMLSEYYSVADPTNIHEKDENTFRQQLKDIITNIQNTPISYEEFAVEGELRKYIVKFESRSVRMNNKAPTKLTWGKYNNPQSNLIHKLVNPRKVEQIKKSDILFLIILNDLIEKESELLDALYKQITIGINFSGKVTKITQYDFEETLWFGRTLKCVIAAYPGNKNVVICPSLFHYEKFSGPEYDILRKIIENKGFSVDFVLHSSTIKKNEKGFFTKQNLRCVKRR